MFGGTVGIFAMCLMQINRLNDENSRKLGEENEKMQPDNKG